MKMLPVKFTKMHGLGNDFIVIDNLTHAIDIHTLPIQTLSHRYTGIGFDQLLFLCASNQADFACQFFNADGSEAEQCGNGLRCIARYCHENGLIKKNNFCVETKAGVMHILIHDYQHIETRLSIPQFAHPKKISDYDLTVLSLGNPHAILTVDSINTFQVKEVGHMIATHSSFKEGVNVGFMQIITPKHFLLRTYERGVGETFACGSNACAAVAAGIKNKLLENKVTVELPLGNLEIEWLGEGHPVVVIGPAESVYEGVIPCKFG